MATVGNPQTLFVFYNLAAVSSLPQVVHKQQLTEATAAGYASASASSIIGQPISSFLFFSVGRALPFIVDAISYLVLVISLFWIRAEFQQERTVEPRNLREDILEGFLWLWRNPLLRFQAFLGAGLNFVVFTTTLIVILLAQRQHALPFTGLIFAIASVGSITGSLLAGRVQKRFSFGQVMIAASWIMVLLWPLYAVAPDPLVLGLIAFGLYLTETIMSAVNISYRLALVPDELQGRVNSVHRLFGFGIGRPLGLVLAGLLSQSFGVITTVMVFWGVWLLLAVSATLSSHVRNAPASV